MFLGILAALERDAAMHGVFKKGSATSREILEIEFGHWPPKGLDFQDKNKLDREVKLTTHFADQGTTGFSKILDTISTVGYVHEKKSLVGSGAKLATKDETIYLNPVMMSSVAKLAAVALSYTLYKRFTSDLSLMGMWDFATDNIFLSGMVLGSALRHVPLTQIAMMPFQTYTHIVGHEHMHILQMHDKKRAKTGFDIGNNTFKKDVINIQDETFTGWRSWRRTADNIFSLGSTQYLLNDVEIQARLHSVMVNGYHRWGRLPRTKHEFWAACIDSGLNAPTVIHEDVKSCKEEGIKDFLKPSLKSAFMRAARKIGNTDVVELNAAQRVLRDGELTQEHWDTTLPFMYGHLLELYGDRTGRAKMGFTKSVDEDGLPQARMTILPPPKNYTAALHPHPAPRPRPRAANEDSAALVHRVA